jgi:hypothetical protein
MIRGDRMEDIEFEVLFEGDENEFIHEVGVNKGFNVEINKVTRCLLLSSDARTLYSNIRSYAYGNKSECYPGIGKLMAQLRWSANKLKKFTLELEEKGLIRVERRNNRLVYKVIEYHKIPLLYHSEIVSSLIPLGYRDGELFKMKVDKYEESELYAKVVESANPIAYEQEIKQWFLDYKFGDEDSDDPNKEPIDINDGSVKVVANSINQRLKLAQKSANESVNFKREKEKSLFDIEKPKKKREYIVLSEVLF